MKAKALFVCLLFICLTTFAGPYIPSYNITYIKGPFRQAIKVDEVYKNFFLLRPYHGLKPTVASGKTTNFVIQKFYNSKYSEHIPSDVSTIHRNPPVLVAGIVQKNFLIQKQFLAP